MMMIMMMIVMIMMMIIIIIMVMMMMMMIIIIITVVPSIPLEVYIKEALGTKIRSSHLSEFSRVILKFILIRVNSRQFMSIHFNSYQFISIHVNSFHASEVNFELLILIRAIQFSQKSNFK